MALPVRLGGLGIINPVEAADKEYQTSVKVTEDLVDLIYHQATSLKTLDKVKVKAKVEALSLAKETFLKAELSFVMSRLDQAAQRSIELLKEQGSGSCLTALPLGRLSYSLSMRVGVGDSFSELCAILSGVPQGSVLGPLLFLLFINDLPENIKNKVFLFADDLKMIANALRKDLVDEDLRVLEDWEDTWSLRFNSEKCKTLHLDRNENPSNEYTIHGDILETIESEKDLGLVVSSNFKWDEQIKSSIAKANKTIAWVSRNIICKDQGVMLLIYKSLVRPHLEYAVQCWAPSPRFGNWSIILELEKVQRKFSRLINDIGTLTYGERLKSLTLTTLAERRMRGDLIEAFKIIRGFVDYGQNLFKLSISGLNILSKITKDTNSDRRDFFSERILKYWNILPKSVKMSESVNSFKANLENYKVRSLANVFHNSTGHFWEVSGHIMDRIETPSYLAGRPAFREYLDSNPWIARRKKINTFQSQ